MTLKKWICNQCKKEYKETGSYKENLGLSFSSKPKIDICIKCYNGGKK